MYMITEAKRKVRIPPSRLDDDIDAVIGDIATDDYVGTLEEDKSIVVLVKDVQRTPLTDADGNPVLGEDGKPVLEPGHIVHGDAGVFQSVTYKQLVFALRDNEVIDGTVVEVKQFGAFIRFGPLDGLLHISQVMDDHVDIDEANQRLVGKESGRFLAVGDRVRARVVSIELNEKSPMDSRIGLTMRQPGLGRLDWIEADARKAAGGDKDDKEKKSKGGEE